MSITDGERKEVLDYIKQTETHLAAYKPSADAHLFEVLKHLVNVCKRLVGDKAPLVD